MTSLEIRLFHTNGDVNNSGGGITHGTVANTLCSGIHYHQNQGPGWRVREAGLDQSRRSDVTEEQTSRQQNE